jgi:hypothetical protein
MFSLIEYYIQLDIWTVIITLSNLSQISAIIHFARYLSVPNASICIYRNPIFRTSWFPSDRHFPHQSNNCKLLLVLSNTKFSR